MKFKGIKLNKTIKLNKKVILVGLIPGLFIITAVFAVNSWFGKSGAGFSSSLLPDWKYRRPITISGHQEDLTDYQVKVELTPSNFDYSHCQSDLDDIRFTDANDNRLLNFWIETASTTATSTIWVKVPALSANKQSKIYMYYGNASASSASDGKATFEFFDDFSTDKFLGDDDTAYVDTANKRAYLRSHSASEKSIYAPASISGNFIYDYEMMIIGYGTEWGGAAAWVANAQTLADATQRASSYQYQYSTSGTDFRNRISVNDLYTNSGDVFDINVRYHKRLKRIGTVYYSYAYNTPYSEGDTEINVVSRDDGVSPDYSYIVLGDCAIGGSGRYLEIYVYDIRVRKYASPEPSATVGSEEIQMTPILHLRMNEGSGTTVYDSTPNNLDANFGSGNNAPTWVTQ